MTYPTPSQDQLDRIAQANFSVAELIGPFESSIHALEANTTELLYSLDAGSLQGMRLRLIEMGDACRDAGLTVPPPAALPPDPPDVVSYYPDISDLERLQTHQSSYAVQVKQSSNVDHRGVFIPALQAGGGRQTYYQGGVTHSGSMTDAVIFPVSPGIAKFGERSYNLSGFTWRDVEICGLGLVSRHSDGAISYIAEGSAWYFNMAGDCSLIGCKAHHNAAQGLQVACRPHLNDGSVAPVNGLLTVSGCSFWENGYWTDPVTGETSTIGDRASDPISINGGGPDFNVHILDTTVTCLAMPDFKGSDGQPRNSRGVLKLLADSWTQGRENAALANGSDSRGEPVWETGKFAYGTVTVERLSARVIRSDRALFFARGIRELTVTGSTFYDSGRKVIIELDPEHQPGSILPTRKNGDRLRPCGTILWEGNNAGGQESEVRLRGVAIGPVEGTYRTINGTL